MATYKEPKNIGDLLLVEVATGWTKGRGIFAQSDAAYEMGTVLSRVDDEYVRYAPPEGEEAPVIPAVAVAAESVDATAGAARGVVIERGATLAKDELVWPDGMTDEQVSDALAELDARGIIAVRQL